MKNLDHNRIRQYLLLLTAFMLPVGKLVPVPLILLGVHWLVSGDLKGKWNSFRKDRLLLLPAVFYLLHASGMLYTDNTASGLFDLEVKSSLLLFPLFLAGTEIGKRELEGVLKAYVLGCLTISICLLGMAEIDHFILGENHFFYEAFSRWHHPSYLAMYLGLAITALCFQLVSEYSTGNQKLSALIMILLFSVVVFLLSSKAGILITVIIWISVFGFYTSKRKKYLLGVAGFVAMVALAIIAWLYVPQVRQRIEAMTSVITGDNTANDPAESNAVRLQVWKAAGEIVFGKEFLIGCGTGDVKETLLAKYKEKGYTGAYEIDAEGKLVKLLNAHNQFLQSFIALGILGFLFSLGMIGEALRAGWKRKNYLLFFFALLVFLNFLTESMLEREAGVMFFGFFYVLLARANVLHELTNKLRICELPTA